MAKLNAEDQAPDVKKYQGLIRTSLLIDEQGKIIQTWYKVSPRDTGSKAIEALEEE
jgi:peroxiredoxin